MNFQQLEYIIAVDAFRNYAMAAENRNVTQPTLSMMIMRLEDELGIKIFDRHRKPLTPTREGLEIIRKAKQVVAGVNDLKGFSMELKGKISGELRLGIIPTLAPYLLPLFLKSFTENYKSLNVFVRELLTAEIIDLVKKGDLDIGILATPLNDPRVSEHVLFYEEFLMYASAGENLPEKKFYLAKDINLDHLWLLQEGHCLRSQVLNLCDLKHSISRKDNLKYEAGSIETLIHMVDYQEGITIVPRLAVGMMTASQKKKLREFADPKPVREISLVSVNNFPRIKLLDLLKSAIIKSLPENDGLKQKRILEIRSDSTQLM